MISFSFLKSFFLLIFFTQTISLLGFSSADHRVLVNPYLKGQQQEKLFLQGKENDWKEFLEREFLTNPFLSLREKSSSNLVHGTRVFSYFFKGKPICQKEIKLIERGEGEVPLVLGDKISLSFQFKKEGQFGFVKEAKNLLDDFYDGVDFSSFEETCYYFKEDSLIPSYQLRGEVLGKPYKFFVSKNEILETRELFFQIQQGEKNPTLGVFQVYSENSVTSSLEKFSYEVSGSGFLENKSFEIFLEPYENGKERKKVYSEKNAFIFSPEEDFYKPTSLFVHAQGMYQYFLDLGYQEWRDQKIVLRAYVTFEGDKNNAMYVPYDDEFSDAPSLSFGEGDGIVLQNILMDANVVSHELTHHIVFQNLRSTSGESLIIHEGLADYFTFAYSGNACLGESICPADSDACVLMGECLRTGENNLTHDVNSTDWHYEGQVLSGTLWDLRKSLGGDVLDKIVFKSLSFFSERTGFYGFILSLMRADENLYSGKNRCEIYNAFVSRGFKSVLDGFTCEDLSTWSDDDISTQSLYGDASSSGVQSREEEEDFSCGTMLSPPGGLGGAFHLSFWFLFLLPVFLVFGHKFILLNRF